MTLLVFIQKMVKLTPGMKQYMEIKNANPDCVILFRMGDFYETFYDDAKTIIESALSNEEGSHFKWLCPGCGEEHESQFTVCWKCGRERP